MVAAYRVDRSSEVPTSWFWATTAALVVLGVAINTFLAYQFYRHNVFYDMNTLFDTDPDVYTWLLLGHPHLSRRHPLMVLLTLPFSSAGAVLSALTGRESMRMWIPILFGPLFSGCRTLLLMLTLRRLRLSLPWSALIALIEIASLARLFFGSEPESFNQTATLFSALLYLLARLVVDGQFSSWRWMVLGVLLGGVTITNFVAFGLVLTCALLLTSTAWMPALWTVARTVLGAAVAIALLYGLIILTIHPQILRRPAVAPSPAAASGTDASGKKPEAQIDALLYMTFDPGRILKDTPLLNTYSFTGPVPKVSPVEPFGSLFPGYPRQRIEFVGPIEYGSQWLFTLPLVTCALAMGTLGWFLNPGGRAIAIPALMIMLFQLTVNTFYITGDLYLYVMQWQTALIVLLAGAWLLPGKWRPAAFALGLLLLVTEVVLNMRVLNFMFDTLERS